MASGKQIQSKIKSIKDTQKITRAMEMVSASKVRKAEQATLSSRPYAEKLREMIACIEERDFVEKHPLLVDRVEENVALVVLSSDRGLCGNMNTALFMECTKFMQKKLDEKKKVHVATIGKKSRQFFSRRGFTLFCECGPLSSKPKAEDFEEFFSILLGLYKDGTFDAIYLAYNEHVNTMTRKPKVDLFFPFNVDRLLADDDGALPASRNYIYEPSADFVFDRLIELYAQSVFFQSILENASSEHAARMVAMKNATENAGDLINNLQLTYNKARQAAITQEIAEIVGGASAV